jgi:glutaredoxin
LGKKYFVYSKPSCTFCDQAKALLESRGLDFEVIMLDVGQPKIDGMQYITRDELLAIFPNARTMPQINRQEGNMVSYVGGFKELKNELDA